MVTKTIDVHDAQLLELLPLVEAGTEIILTEGNTPVARLVPIDLSSSPRIAGLHRGAIMTTDDFDEPLSDEFWTGTARSFCSILMFLYGGIVNRNDCRHVPGNCVKIAKTSFCSVSPAPGRYK